MLALEFSQLQFPEWERDDAGDGIVISKEKRGGRTPALLVLFRKLKLYRILF
jgi:hypothetical protein